MAKGSALISALFIMALVAIAATAMSLRMQTDIYRTRMILTSDKLMLASDLVDFWALEILNQKKLKFTPNDPADLLAEFPPRLQSIYPQLKLEGQIYDLQAKINLNNFSRPRTLQSFMLLLEKHTPQLNPGEKFIIVRALYDWLSAYDKERGRDIFMQYYMKRKPPYYPAHMKFSSPTEFRLIQGVTQAVYQSLIPFLTALPGNTAINLNTAPKSILKTLSRSLKSEQINELIQARQEAWLEQSETMSQLLKKLNISPEMVTYESQYYLVVSKVIHEDLTLIKKVVMSREKDKKDKIIVRIIRQCINC